MTSKGQRSRSSPHPKKIRNTFIPVYNRYTHSKITKKKWVVPCWLHWLLQYALCCYQTAKARTLCVYFSMNLWNQNQTFNLPIPWSDDLDHQHVECCRLTGQHKNSWYIYYLSSPARTGHRQLPATRGQLTVTGSCRRSLIFPRIFNLSRNKSHRTCSLLNVLYTETTLGFWNLYIQISPSFWDSIKTKFF